MERVRQVAEVEMLDSFHPVPGEGPGSQTAPPGAPQAGAGFDLVQGLRRLRENYGIRRLLLEGGPRLNYMFLREGLVDELFWTVAPKIAGTSHDLTLAEGPSLLLPLPRLQLVSLFQHGDELFLRYRVKALEEGK